MILVNTPGSVDHVYAPLTHAAWHGWTCADLIFPFFLFIVGVAITLSFPDSHLVRAYQRSIVLHALRRFLILFTLGLLLYNFPYYHLSTLRILGVLQRIALCYLCAVLVFLNTNIWGQAAVTAALLALYWALMMLMPIPGAGVLEPNNNLAASVDSLLLHGHLAYGTWDPEGLLSTVPAVATTLVGVLAGYWLKTPSRSLGEKTSGFMVTGIAAIVMGQAMDHWFPINKNLWTSSYVVFTGGMALLVFAVCYWLVDGKGYRRVATPFIIFGMNPILVYVLATLGSCLLDLYTIRSSDGTSLTLKTILYEHYFASWAGPTTGSLLFALVYLVVWFAPMAVLYHKRIFIKI
jgi:predicted acyltransferase